MNNLTQEWVKKFFHYDPLSGQVTRIARFKPIPGGTDGTLVPISWPLNKPSAGGYIHARFFGKYVALHILIYVYMIGDKCKHEIDHIDGNRTNNKWNNLRVVDSSDNSCNRGIRSDNSSGVVGVYRHSGGKYAAQIQRRGIYRQLGYYDTFEEACRVRRQAEIDLNFHPNHGRRRAWSK